MQARAKLSALNMEAKKVEKVITTPKDRNGHPLKRHLTEIKTRVNNLKYFDGVNTEVGWGFWGRGQTQS